MNRVLWILVALFVPLAACGEDDGSEEESERVEAIAALQGDATAASDTYSSTCSVCHGADGTGTPSGNDLTAVSLSDEVVIETILYGRGTMAPYENAFDDQEIANLTALVQNF